MQKVNLFETERMFADLYCLEPGQEQKLHAHSGADKVYFVLEGTGRFQIGDDDADLGPDQIVLAPANIPHGVRNDSAARLVLLVFMAPNPNKG
ncbi:MAG: cupin domain-containing protein [Blastocatellia bacterium]